MITTMPPTGKSGSANLSSSTIDGSVLLAAEGCGSRNGSLRRRKVRLRKRTFVSNVVEVRIPYFLQFNNVFTIIQKLVYNMKRHVYVEMFH
jgi:hypothetical protein